MMDDKNIAVENLIGRDKVIELLKERAKTSLYAHAERLLRIIIRDIEAIPIMNPQEHEPQRIWSCLNCGNDIYFDISFVHVDSGEHKCSNRISNYDNIAIPHPDKPMRTE